MTISGWFWPPLTRKLSVVLAAVVILPAAVACRPAEMNGQPGAGPQLSPGDEGISRLYFDNIIVSSAVSTNAE